MLCVRPQACFYGTNLQQKNELCEGTAIFLHKKQKKMLFVSVIWKFIVNFALIRHARYIYRTTCVLLIITMMAMHILSACSPSHKDEVDRLNDISYAYHYRNLDTVRVMAQRAMSLSADYGDGYAEACNNMAFVAMAKMRMAEAKRWLAEVEQHTDNQIELLVADVQNMRICQREAHNKDFYAYREAATHRLRRIGEEARNLPLRDWRRAVYAHSEFDIVDATYFYYVSLEEPMQRALNDLKPDEMEQDTAQYLNYLYNFGSGGALADGTQEEIYQTEFDYLMRCYMLASAGNAYPYWQAQALQALSEHLLKPAMRDFLIKNNQPAIQYLNIDHMAPDLLAGNFAQRALSLFCAYGDVYQKAGAYRTLAECYGAIGDYPSAISCLNQALSENKEIQAAPDLVASIREQLSLAYSALDDKPRSDYNRNLYLDLQEQSRQDRQLEARATQLDKNALQLNTMIAAVLAMITLVLVLLFVFDRMRRHKDKENPVSKLLEPLSEWKEKNTQSINDLDERKEEIDEAIKMARLHLLDNRKRNLEQRAKIALVNSITPFIDRMVNEVNRLSEGKDSETVRQERCQYISELTEKINQYNDILTQWIQMRQGTLSLRIESFPLQPLFDIVAKAKMSYLMKGVQLLVQPTEAVVKADRTLTLFMINTIADNARKFTSQGGTVTVSAHMKEDCVEVEVMDDGEGMDEAELSHVFDRTYTGGHGFGLLNCKGIIEKYKKLSKIFQLCDIRAESQKGRGSKFVFSLPRGVQRLMLFAVLFVAMLVNGTQPMTANTVYLKRAGAFADSTYFCNINAHYRNTLRYADSARHYLNLHYLSIHPQGKDLMERTPQDGKAAELKWLHDSLSTNYDIILDIRNESAVAALALHDWQLYHSNNKVYTQLFRERSADETLPDYVRTMQVSENSKTVAVILLILLLLQLPLAYYLLYFRHVLSNQFAIDKVNAINKVLLGGDSDEEKLEKVHKLWDSHNGPKKINRQLDELVAQIEESLRHGMEISKSEAENIEIAEDELHCVEYENARLHIANSVMDNCLSTLKHETMYYPSRIRQLIESRSNDIVSLRELVDYYKQLYTLLSAQAMQQAETEVRLDYDKLDHLFDLLRQLGGAAKGTFARETCGKDAAYTIFRIPMPRLKLTPQQCAQLFTALTIDLRFLLCRQMVREIGEVTNMRACGISTSLSKEGDVMVEVILPKDIDKKYKIEI